MRGRKKILAALMALLVLPMAACGTKGEEMKKTEIDFSTPASAEGVPEYAGKELTLGAWYSPDLKEELWQWYKEAGLNEVTIFPANTENEEYLKGALQYCKQYGIRANIHISNSLTFKGKSWEEQLAGYEDVVTGFVVYDEPALSSSRAADGRADLDALLPTVRALGERFPTKKALVTLWPNYATAAQIGLQSGESYSDYVEAYCNKVLSALPAGAHRSFGFDFYPYYETRFDGGILSNLEVLQHYAVPNGAELYQYIQTMDSKKLHWRKPDYDELSLQYYTALSYGVKNLQMFCYQEPKRQLLNGDFGFTDGEAMITDGFTFSDDNPGYHRTQIYSDVKKLNGEIKKLSEALSEFEWQGVLTSLGTVRRTPDDFTLLQYTLSSYAGIKSYTAEDNLLLGCFKDERGNDGFMVTNYSNPVNFNKSRVDLDFGSKTRALVYKRGVKYVVNLIGGHYVTDLDGGEGQFVVPLA